MAKCFLIYPSDGAQRMRVCAYLLHQYAFAVEGVYTHMARGVDYTAIAHADADMYYTAVSVVEESKVVALHITEAHLVAACGLLRSIARQPYTHSLKAYLCKPGTVDATRRAAAPKIGGAEIETLGQVGRRVERHVLLVVDPSLVAVVVRFHEAPFLLAIEHVYRVAQKQLVHHFGAVACLGPHRHRTQKNISFHSTSL